ncbi:MAG: divergent polysaccharide deacetylase family protein [Desulfobacula sp.]|nr:divergent polysaccharide deacetylase family protein [Desulfobacula sp.]
MPTKNKPKNKNSKKTKIAAKKQKKPRKSAKPPVLNEFKKILVGIAILVSLCLTLAMIADIFLHPESVDKKQSLTTIKKQQSKPKIKPVEEGIKEVKNKKTVAGLKQKPEKTFKYEVFGEIDQTIIEKKFPSPQKGHIPKIVIIIDDIGYDKKIAMALCDLNSNITFSVLPFAPFGKTISKQLHAKGSQLMLHLPMEPFEYPDVNPGPGAILSSMSPDILLDQLKKSINDIPNIVGVNNHMGSRITTNSDQMNQIFSTLKKKDLFFIDSRTAPKSQCKASARLFKLKFAQRDVFLDNFQNQEYITGQFNKLKALAKKHGFAIGIGHPYKATLHTLARELPKLEKKIQIVRASALTSIPG